LTFKKHRLRLDYQIYLIKTITVSSEKTDEPDNQALMCNVFYLTIDAPSQETIIKKIVRFGSKFDGIIKHKLFLDSK